MAIVKGILIGVVGLIALFLAISLFLPDAAHVERSILIDAPQAAVFALTNSFARFNEWSPWAERDPEATYTFEGPARGVGAKMSWTSDHPNVGSGSQQILTSLPFERVTTHLDFGDQGTAEAFFKLASVGDAVQLTWGFDTEFGFDPIGRWFGLLFDTMLGPDYETGLANLKALAESLPDADWGGLEIDVVELEPITIAATRDSCAHEMDLIGPALAKAYGKVGRFLAANELETTGMPLAINHEWKDTYAFEAGIPIELAEDASPASIGDVRISRTPGGTMVRAVHVGPYAEMGSTYAKIKAFAAAYGLELAEPSWEQYISDPGDTPEPELVTHIYYPVR